MRQQTWWLVAVGLVAAIPAGAQLPALGVPRGVFRLELGGEFNNADSRYNDGAVEDIARSFTAPMLGGGYFPALRDAESRIARILGSPSYQYNLGRVSANGLINIGTGTIGLSYGLTRRITVFAVAPIVQTRRQIRILVDSSGADAGFNPADPVFGTAAGRSETAQFFTDFDGALTTLSQKIANGDYDANPTQKAQAQAALADGTLLRDDLAAVLGDPQTPFAPTLSSAAGAAVINAVTSLQNTFTGLSVGGFASLPALADARLSRDDYEGFVSNPAGPVAGFPLVEANLSRIGDMETGVVFTVVDRWNRPGRPGGFRTALEARFRLPTGLVDQPANFLDIGTGSGHFAARVRGVMDLGAGRVGLRLAGSWEHVFPATLTRRVAPPTQAIAYANTEADVRESPGSTLEILAAPFFRLVSTLGLQAGVRYRRHGQDSYAFASASSGVPAGADVLGRSSDWTTTSVMGGITYVSPAVDDPASTSLPVEAFWTIEGPVHGSGGIVAKERIARMGLRVYVRP
ncbi:MAG: hypothetical protein AB7Q69_12120 [Gemmatimonadales bacterium]